MAVGVPAGGADAGAKAPESTGLTETERSVREPLFRAASPLPEAFYKHRNIDCNNCPVGTFCCTLKVRLSLRDRLRILFHTGLRTRQYADRLFDGNGWGIRLVKGDCYFLKRLPEGKAFCTIYNARPSICRKFPHFFEDINDCRDIVRKWSRRIVKDVDVTEVELARPYAPGSGRP